MQEISQKEAIELVDRVGDCVRSKDYDMTYGPDYPEGRKDICAVKHMTENGSTYGYDQIFLLWKESDGTLRYKEIRNSKSSKEYLNVGKIEIKSDGSITVEIRNAGTYKGSPWNEDMRAALAAGAVCDSASASFEEIVRQETANLVELNLHNHPQYKSTCVKESMVDEERKIAVCILFEQIDTDGGFKGNQFRYSLWKLEQGKRFVRLYEDHAYINDRANLWTGDKSRGRNCVLKNLRIEEGVVKVSHSKGDVENEEWEELEFSL